MSLSKRLRKLREEKNITREELADRIGVSYSSIAKYETPLDEGGRTPRYELQEKLADVFGVSIDYLNGRSDNRYPLQAKGDRLTHSDEADFLGEIAFLAKKGGELTEDEISILKDVFRMIEKRVEERKLEGK